jgi:diacylglycerol kinase
MMRKSNYSLIQSFIFALRGIAHALRHERNLRIHFAIAAYVLFFAIRYYSLSGGEYALLLLVIGLVITCELFNTAIEKTVDIETPVYNGLAKIAKDVAAGAVLVSALTAVVVGLFLLWNPAIFAVILREMADYFYLWLLVFTVTVLWIVWPQRCAIRRNLSKGDKS